MELVNVHNVIQNRGKSLGGGSHASSNVEMIFKKNACGLGHEKLCDEIKFLIQLPSALSNIYPKMYFYEIKDNESSLSLEYIPYPTLRDNLFCHKFSEKDTFYIVTKILKNLSNLYENTFFKTPDFYLKKYHFDRLFKRIHQSKEMAKIFEPIINCKNLIVNGKYLKNISYIIPKLLENKHCDMFFKPCYVSKFIHSDLHFENILVHPLTLDYKLVDPRGYEFCDIFYDIGKINHSTHGKYDFIHENRFF